MNAEPRKWPSAEMHIKATKGLKRLLERLYDANVTTSF